MKKIYLIVPISILIWAWTHLAYAHCEIPCGIYDDEMRIMMIAEHISTIEKSMNMILELSKKAEKDYNQLIRWINNKEQHAHYIQDIVSQYFMTQRVKPVDKGNTEDYKQYVEKIAVLHEMLVYAMKAKQTTDVVHVEKLRSLLEELRSLYFEHEH